MPLPLCQTQVRINPVACRRTAGSPDSKTSSIASRFTTRQAITSGPTFVWSRDNGSVAAAISAISGNQISLLDPANNVALTFDGVQWVEIIDDTAIPPMAGKPELLVPVTLNGTTLTVTSWPNGTLANSNYPASPINPVVRKWDITSGPGPIPITPGSLQLLENGISVQFDAASATYQTGDYWLIPARTLTGTIEWPSQPGSPTTPLALPPVGIDHHYAPLGLFVFDGKQFTSMSDCRRIFPPLTSVNTFFYVGGDGRNSPPIHCCRRLCTLCPPLQVGVSTGSGATVQFRVTSNGNGVVSPGEAALQA